MGRRGGPGMCLANKGKGHSWTLVMILNKRDHYCNNCNNYEASIFCLFATLPSLSDNYTTTILFALVGILGKDLNKNVHD